MTVSFGWSISRHRPLSSEQCPPPVILQGQFDLSFDSFQITTLISKLMENTVDY